MLAGARDWDLALSAYQRPDAEPLLRHAEWLMTGGLSKYHAAALFQAAAGGLEGYEQVLFLDDDVALGFDPAALFAYQQREGFALAQAALSHDSHASFRLLLACPAFHYRCTNFVEVMAPSMRADFLRLALPFFTRSISTWGLDLLWSTLLGEGREAAVIDDLMMRHTRAIRPDGAFYRYLLERGINPSEELRSILVGLGMPQGCAIGITRFVARQDVIAMPNAFGNSPLDGTATTG